MQNPDTNPGTRYKEVAAQIRSAIKEAMDGVDFVTLNAKLAQARPTLSREGVAEQNYAKAVEDAANKLTMFIKSGDFQLA